MDTLAFCRPCLIYQLVGLYCWYSSRTLRESRFRRRGEIGKEGRRKGREISKGSLSQLLSFLYSQHYQEEEEGESSRVGVIMISDKLELSLYSLLTCLMSMDIAAN